MNHKSIHRAWVILVAMTMIHAGVMGVLFNCCGIVFSAIRNELGFRAGDLSVYYMLRSLTTALMVGFTSKLYFSSNARVVMTVLGTLYVGSFAAMAFFNSLWQWYIAAVICGIGMSCNMVVIPATLNNWFKVRNGFVIGLTMSSSGIIGAIFSPICSSLITMFGWRQTVLIMAVILIILPAAFLLVSEPEKVGLKPYGYEKAAASASDKAETLRQTPPHFIFLLTMIAAIGPGSLIQFNAQLPIFAESIGYTMAVGAMFTSLSMVGNLAGKLGLGALADRIGIYKSGQIFFLTIGLSMVGMLLGQSQLMILNVSTLLYGAVYCITTTMPALLYLDLYGSKEYRSRVSRMQAISGGIVSERKTKITKNNTQMAFLTVEDLYGQFEVVVFPGVFERSRQYLEPDSKIYIKGHINIGRDENATLIADEIIPFDMVRKEIWIAFSDKAEYDGLAGRLEELCFENTGTSDVIVYLRKEKARKRLDASLRTDASEGVLEKLRQVFGADNVKIRELGF